MWYYSCIVLLGVASANATPAWFYNTGFEDSDPSGLGCTSFTKEYDPYTGYFTYRCEPDVMNNNHLSSPTFLNTSPDNTDVDDIESVEYNILTPQESFSGRLGYPHAKVTYQHFTSGRSGGSRRKNIRPKRPGTIRFRGNRCPSGQMFQSELDTCINYSSAPPLSPKRPSSHRLSSSSRRNRCRPGQLFQSELNTCIDYPSASPLSPKQRPSSNRLHSYDRMLGDAPVRRQPPSVVHQRTPASGTILAVGKFSTKTRCKPTELYISELDICLPKNNCYPYGLVC